MAKTVMQIDSDGRNLNKFKNCYEAARFLLDENTNKDGIMKGGGFPHEL